MGSFTKHATNPDRRGLMLRVIYALCLAGATFNHFRAIAQHGLFWDRGGLPWMSNTFWLSLAVLDPIAIVLLFAWPNLGVAMTAAIISVDVIHNLWITAVYFPPLFDQLRHAPQLQEQIAFLIFVGATAPFAWRQTAKGND